MSQGPLLFNVFVNDIFWFAHRTKICNYADDATIFACHPDLDTIIKQLEEDSSVIVKWFSDNFLKLKRHSVGKNWISANCVV